MSPVGQMFHGLNFCQFLSVFIPFQWIVQYWIPRESMFILAVIAFFVGSIFPPTSHQFYPFPSLFLLIWLLVDSPQSNRIFEHPLTEEKKLFVFGSFFSKFFDCHRGITLWWIAEMWKPHNGGCTRTIVGIFPHTVSNRKKAS